MALSDEGNGIQATLPLATQSALEIAAEGFRLFNENYDWKHNVRAVTVRAIELQSEDTPDQLKATNDVNNLIFKDEVYDIKKQAAKRKYSGIETILQAIEQASAIIARVLPTPVAAERK